MLFISGYKILTYTYVIEINEQKSSYFEKILINFFVSSKRLTDAAYKQYLKSFAHFAYELFRDMRIIFHRFIVGNKMIHFVIILFSSTQKWL